MTFKNGSSPPGDDPIRYRSADSFSSQVCSRTYFFTFLLTCQRDMLRARAAPFNHSHKVAKFCYADKNLINKAIAASVAARREWDLKPVQDRAEVLFRAADALSGPYRAEVLAKTMMGQGKTVVQAEIDAAAELIDFFRFNAKHAVDLQHQQPLDADGSTNTMLYRGLEGNVVLWKPSDTAMSASYLVYRVLRESGLPPNIVQFLPADGPVFGDAVTASEHLAAVNFTGSRLWKQVAQNLDNYRNFPRLAGECGGKNFHFVHASADVESVVKGTIRSAFEYGGQKCSACSRIFSTFFSAVIDDKSFARIKKWLDHAKSSPNLKIIAGGNYDDSKGYFVEPTIIQTSDPKDAIMSEEVFGPVLSVYVYPEKDYREVLQLIDSTQVIEEASAVLRNAAGNYYVNDKSTGSVVAQQPFGGARASGGEADSRPPHRVEVPLHGLTNHSPASDQLTNHSPASDQLTNHSPASDQLTYHNLASDPPANHSPASDQLTL
ncbi:hypothetical protein F7725_016269 [Dissostichus mawsoni]|uniref:Aldehyde dehydrogenase domain-containing protein n=1 Tax=Dissostichus mawsoni TaxID=36200 RepID=A0A7J5Z1K6_DISMA|nr:hypothetical protein F7725_016269 [Dissostichus mawsoni]